VDGKVVLVINFEPHDKEGNSRFTNNERTSRDGRLFSKARAAQEAGAAALLVVNPPIHHDEEDKLMEFGRGSQRTEIPVFSIDRGTAQNLLRAAGLPNLRKLQQDIDTKGEPVKAEPAKAVAVSGGFEAADRTLPVKNVVGLLPGKKTDEYIVVGGHYDHVGMGEYGSSYGRAIHNGADDNGSGTVTVLALAEAFAKNPEKPERSIIFMTFTAEELGLIGSRHFADNPPVPTEQIVAMVNLDMVGRIRDNKVFVGGYSSSKAFPGIVQAADEKSPLTMEDMGNDFASRSDHASFIAKQIPAVFFFSGLHEEYHSPSDDAPLINYEGMEQLAEAAYEVIQAIDSASREELAFNAPEPQEMMEGEQGAAATPPGGEAQPAAGNPAASERRVRLGVMPDMAANRTTGILVGGITADTPAAKAGLKTGDILLKIGDREMKSIQDLQDVLVESTPGTKVKVLIERDGQQQEIEVTLE
jgi:Zn-dependent M28 family amino/carboxypeptidase